MVCKTTRAQTFSKIPVASKQPPSNRLQRRSIVRPKQNSTFTRCLAARANATALRAVTAMRSASARTVREVQRNALHPRPTALPVSLWRRCRCLACRCALNTRTHTSMQAKRRKQRSTARPAPACATNTIHAGQSLRLVSTLTHLQPPLAVRCSLSLPPQRTPLRCSAGAPSKCSCGDNCTCGEGCKCVSCHSK